MEIERQVDIDDDILLVVDSKFDIAVRTVPFVEFLDKCGAVGVLLKANETKVFNLDEVVRVTVFGNNDRDAHDAAVIELLTHTDDVIFTVFRNVLAVFHLLFVEFRFDRLERAVFQPVLGAAESVKKIHLLFPPFNFRSFIPGCGDGALAHKVPSNHQKYFPQCAYRVPSWT